MLMPSSRFDLPFTCVDATGLPTAPTGTPTATLIKNGVDQSTAVTVTMTGAQGIASCTIPSDAAAGDRFYIRVSAVISAVTYVVAGPSEAIESPKTLTTAYDPAKSTAPTPAINATAVRTELATELARIDAAISSRLAASSYSAPASSPTAADIASHVRSELSTELARVDAAISSRATPGTEMTLSSGERATLAGVIEAGLLDDVTGGSFMATLQSQIQAILGNSSSNSNNTPIEPIASAVATAVRTNLATELARLDATVSSRLAAASYSASPTLAGLATSDAVTSLATAIHALPNAPQIAAEILIDPSKKLLTNNEGYVTSTNEGGGIGGVVSNSTFVMPLRSTSLERVQANRIDLFVREQVPLTISIFDGQKQPVNCEGLECTFLIEGDIEIPGLTPTAETTGGMANRYSFTPPEAMTSAAATRWFSLRVNDATQRVLAFGHLVIAQVP